MNFNFSQDQLAIRDVAERIFRDLAGDASIRNCFKQAVPFHRELWQQLAGSGLLAAPLPSHYGGSDMGLTELCMLIEVQGRTVAPVPLIECVVECAMPIAQFASDDLKQRILPALASGEQIAVAARPYTGLQPLPPLQAQAADDGWLLNGVSALCAYAPLAQGFLVSAIMPDAGHWIGYCDADSAGLALTAQTNTSGEPTAQLTFTNVQVTAANCIATADAAAALLEWQAQRTCTALAAQQVGILQEGLKRAAEYTSQRTQFKRPLASFQAVAQQAADAYMAVEALRGVYWRALDDIEHGNAAAGLSARVAKFWICESGHTAAHIFLHLHGGIGQDLDYPLHRFFSWAKKNELYLGGAGVHTAELGKLIGENLQQLAH